MVVPLCAALCAAVVAHNLIDVAGDDLLPHDTFDDAAHGSRLLFGGAALALIATILGIAVAAAIREARGVEAAFCRALRSLAPGDGRAFVATVVGLTFAALVAMQGLDTVIAGTEIDGLASLLGGSLLLGGACTLVSGVFAALGARMLFERVVSIHRAVVAFAVALVRRASSAATSSRAARPVRRRRRASGAVASTPSAGRAPPPLALAS